MPLIGWYLITVQVRGFSDRSRGRRSRRTDFVVVDTGSCSLGKYLLQCHVTDEVPESGIRHVWHGEHSQGRLRMPYETGRSLEPVPSRQTWSNYDYTVLRGSADFG